MRTAQSLVQPLVLAALGMLATLIMLHVDKPILVFLVPKFTLGGVDQGWRTNAQRIWPSPHRSAVRRSSACVCGGEEGGMEVGTQVALYPQLGDFG